MDFPAWGTYGHAVEVAMTIEQRIAHLERSNTRLRRAAAVALVLSLGSITLHFAGNGQAAGAPDIVAAKEFVLLDAKGEKRGSWNAADGAPGIVMMSASGNGVMMSASKDGAAISASTSTKTAEIKVDGTTATFSAVEGDSKLAAAVGFTSGDPRLFLSNRAGTMVSYPPSR